MRIIFYLSALLNIVSALVTAMMLRGPMATHFDGKGSPNGWETPSEYVIFTMGLTIGCLALFALFDYLVKICPASSFNVPNHEYWRSEEHLPEMRRIMRRFLQEFGVYMFLFMTVVNGMIAWSNRFNPPRLPDGEEIFIGVFVAIVLIWTIRLFLAFRIPKENANEIT